MPVIGPMFHAGIRYLNINFTFDYRVKFVASFSIGYHIFALGRLNDLKGLRQVPKIWILNLPGSLLEKFDFLNQLDEIVIFLGTA